MTWTTFAADAPRFVLPNNALLLEGQRTNDVSNPRAEGLVAGNIGSGGAVPTGYTWTGLGTATSTLTMVGVGTDLGLPYFDFRFEQPAGGDPTRFRFANSIAVTAGDSVTVSVFARLIAGSLSGNDQFGFVITYDTADVSITAFAPATGSLGRFSTTVTVPAGATTISAGLYLRAAAGVAADVTVRIAAPQLERGSLFASTPILPPAGTPGASTRGHDNVSASLTSLTIGDNGVCTVLLTGTLLNGAANIVRNIVQIDNGGLTNRYLLQVAQNVTQVRVQSVVSGLATGNANMGAYAVNTPFRAGIALDGSGRAAASLDGNAVVAVTGGVTSGLTTLRLGMASSAGASPMFGTISRLTVIPRTLSDAELQAAVAAFPST